MKDKVKNPRFDAQTQSMLDELLTLDKRDALKWALDVAERTLDRFEIIAPEDPRPRTCITLGRQWLTEVVPFKLIRTSALAAHAAARSVEDPYAIAAARACGHAIATIHVQTHCIGAAIYGLKACRNESERLIERVWQIQHLKDIKESVDHYEK
ncbi:MAG: hypothetical protein FD179_916 [Erysipelotrichaceae bacterium]|nr:MAG: hypothetical protein FD179_916 [Erysipelotrichaceae bacterium]